MVASRRLQSLAKADERVESIMAQIEALNKKLEVVREQRIDIIGEAALAAFPELDGDEYGEDLVEFFTGIRDDAYEWRKYQESLSDKSDKKKDVVSTEDEDVLGILDDNED